MYVLLYFSAFFISLAGKYINYKKMIQAGIFGGEFMLLLLSANKSLAALPLKFFLDMREKEVVIF
jgi:hypothetical protein